MKALVPCHSSTPKSASKSSVSVYHGMLPAHPRLPALDVGLRRARDERERGVARVQVGEVGDLVGEEGAAAAAAARASPPRRARRRSGRRSAGGARRTGRAGSPARPGPRSAYSFSTAIRGIRRRSAASASRARVSSFSLTSSSSRAASHSCGRDDRRGVHRASFLLQVLVDDVEQAPPEGALAIHPVGRLAEHVGLEREPVRPALDHARHDARLLQHLQVLGDRGLGHPEAAGGVADGRRACGEALDDAAADRVREGLERIVNH